MSTKKLLTIDFDGVICGTYFPFKIGFNNNFLDSANSPPTAFIPPKIISTPLDKIRYAARPILPDVQDALQELSITKDLILLTGRRNSPINWLKKYNIDTYFSRIIINNTKFASSHYKLYKILELNAAYHIDDDAQTVQLISDSTNCTVFLRNWKYNQNDNLNKKITKIDSIKQIVKLIN